MLRSHFCSPRILSSCLLSAVLALSAQAFGADERGAVPTMKVGIQPRAQTYVSEATVEAIRRAGRQGVIVLNEVPRALHDHRPYALCAFAGGWVMVAGQALHWPEEVALLTAAALTSALRVAVLLSGYTLPSWAAGGPPRG